MGAPSPELEATWQTEWTKIGLLLTENERNSKLAEHQKWRTIVEAIEHATEQGLDIYLKLLHHTDAGTRTAAASVLSRFKTHQNRLAPYLWAAIQTEPDLERI